MADCSTNLQCSFSFVVSGLLSRYHWLFDAGLRSADEKRGLPIIPTDFSGAQNGNLQHQ
jgi:hypothetical protein